MNKGLMLGLSLGVSVIGASLLGCSESPDEVVSNVVQPVKVSVIGSGESGVVREFPATVRATQRAAIAFQVSGKLVELPVQEGMQVEKGQLLAHIDDTDYRSSVSAAEAERSKTEGNYKRAKGLLADNYVSEAEFDTISAAYDVAKSNLEKAEKALRDTRLLAPFSGVVARTFVENFQEVQAKETVLSLQNNSALELVVNVPENMIVRRDHKMKIIVTGSFDAIPDKVFPLSVKEFATEADSSTQTFQYVLNLEDTSGHNLLPGMTATVRLETQGGLPAERVVLPLAALVAGEQAQKTVWTVSDDGSVHAQPVAVGELVGADKVSVLTGLAVGDRVVIAGMSAMREGLIVKPIEKVDY